MGEETRVIVGIELADGDRQSYDLSIGDWEDAKSRFDRMFRDGLANSVAYWKVRRAEAEKKGAKP